MSGRHSGPFSPVVFHDCPCRRGVGRGKVCYSPLGVSDSEENKPDKIIPGKIGLPESSPERCECVGLATRTYLQKQVHF